MRQDRPIAAAVVSDGQNFGRTVRIQAGEVDSDNDNVEVLHEAAAARADGRPSSGQAGRNVRRNRIAHANLAVQSVIRPKIPGTAVQGNEMKVDALLSKDFAELVPDARARAGDGYDALWVSEAQHDPFLQCLEVARVAPQVQVGTSIAIAFARSPMTPANAGYDLARYTNGRFLLGLGPQIKPHIERRFSMP